MADPTCRPILFSGAMVRAILDGRKIQTRRLVKPSLLADRIEHCPGFAQDSLAVCPYGVPGDRLWVRERARLVGVEGGDPIATGVGPARVRLRYEADGVASDWLPYPERLAALVVGNCISNGVHREGARIFLEVTGVRVERLHDISEEDARAEGFVPEPPGSAFDLTVHDLFRHTWLDLYGAESWNTNPWVWVVSFSRERGEG